MHFYRKEYCYLTDKGKSIVDLLISKGLDADLALEVAHISLPNEELYDLGEEVPNEKRRLVE